MSIFNMNISHCLRRKNHELYQPKQSDRRTTTIYAILYVHVRDQCSDSPGGILRSILVFLIIADMFFLLVYQPAVLMEFFGNDRWFHVN
ncbi:hypothetical protein MAR_016328 [Mya arenaria]|uniref:Uncharacterized protein n=1 Tax=Mya arenaria TaxID=6604 RepID=A0ABY7FNB2_MYAAR|nr:hypothetical protein MAR_016328 [Mya arenaria]